MLEKFDTPQRTLPSLNTMEASSMRSSTGVAWLSFSSWSDLFWLSPNVIFLLKNVWGYVNERNSQFYGEASDNFDQKVIWKPVE